MARRSLKTAVGRTERTGNVEGVGDGVGNVRGDAGDVEAVTDTVGASEAYSDGASQEALRCMAHPARMRLLGALRVGGVQTVGELSAATGEAPGAVSYHLAQLAKVGLVEKALSPDGDKRKSHWRACHHATNVRPDSADADVIDMFSRTAALSYQMAYERFLDVLPTLPREWADTCGANDRVLRLTPAETRAMVEELNEVMRKWGQVSERRNDDARAVEAATAASADDDGDGDGDVQPVAVVQQVFRWVP